MREVDDDAIRIGEYEGTRLDLTRQVERQFRGAGDQLSMRAEVASDMFGWAPKAAARSPTKPPARVAADPATIAMMAAANTRTHRIGPRPRG